MLKRLCICTNIYKLNAGNRAQIVAALVEGNTINATVRMIGAAKHTVIKLLADLGKACAAYQDRVLRTYRVTAFN